MPGKIKASLNNRLQAVKWGEYKLGNLFEIENTLSFNTDKLIPGNDYDYITRTSFNQGILRGTGFVNQENINPAGTWSLGLLQMDFFYRKKAWYAGQFIRKVVPKIKIEGSAILFFSTILNKLKKNLLSVLVRDVDDTFRATKVLLPTKDGKIDFEFIDGFVAELEALRVAELEAYLKVTGFDNYELTKEEQDSLAVIEAKNVLWREFKMEELFEKISTIKLPYKAKELPEEATDNFVLPCLTSSFKNQGLNYYAPKDGATILKDVISIPSNSDVYRAYFQSNEFTVLSDAYAIRWKDKSMHISQNQYLFMVMCINKFTDLPIYSYKNKLGGWNVVKNKCILLPVKKDKIDFDFMETFINAIKKLTLKNVAEYADKRIAATKEVIQNDKDS